MCVQARMRTHVHVCMIWRTEGLMCEGERILCEVGSRNQTQVTRLALWVSKCLCTLSHSVFLKVYIFFIFFIKLRWEKKQEKKELQTAMPHCKVIQRTGVHPFLMLCQLPLALQ